MGWGEVLKKIEDKKAVVGVIGLGYVGLPLATVFHENGLSLVGFDIDEEKVRKLDAGESYMRHIDNRVVQELRDSERFRATSKFTELADVDVYVMCLPTPLGAHEEPDMSYVFHATEQIAAQLRGDQLVVLESTTYPGATDTDICDIIRSTSALKVGSDVFVAYSPERENPAGIGDEAVLTEAIPKLVGGVEKHSGTLVHALYRAGGFNTVVEVGSARIAECSKLLENIFRVVNIALVNELKLVFERLDVDIWEVLDAADTKPFGFKRFNPGPGIGGHCIPVDPFYLTWKAKEVGQHCNFIEISGRVNAAMPGHVVNKVQSALNDDCKSVKGSRILILGLAYKKNVDDMREAPALKIWELLLDLHAEVHYHDPSHDAVVLVTDHDGVDYGILDCFSGPVIDTRNKLARDSKVRVIPA
mmetsp:Transcript_7066/g.21557  ORF Transcript_7066/g.21557 Transcript_7066/m.21557 type:complete len:417 (+) Transcript_7066:143-1393(+)